MYAVFILLHSFLSSALIQEIYIYFMYLRFGSEFGTGQKMKALGVSIASRELGNVDGCSF